MPVGSSDLEKEGLHHYWVFFFKERCGSIVCVKKKLEQAQSQKEKKKQNNLELLHP